MRISDWSSDVCSSDLGRFDFGRLAQQDDGDAPVARRPGLLRDEVLLVGAADDRGDALGRQPGGQQGAAAGVCAVGRQLPVRVVLAAGEIGSASCWESVCQYV